jgi:hypothetical protein
MRKPVMERNPAFGLQKFISISELDSHKYVDNEQIFLKIELTETDSAYTITYE